MDVDNSVSETFLVYNKGLRQSDPVLPKLFTAIVEYTFKEGELTVGLDVDRQTLSNLIKMQMTRPS